MPFSSRSLLAPSLLSVNSGVCRPRTGRLKLLKTSLTILRLSGSSHQRREAIRPITSHRIGTRRITLSSASVLAAAAVMATAALALKEAAQAAVLMRKASTFPSRLAARQPDVWVLEVLAELERKPAGLVGTHGLTTRHSQRPATAAAPRVATVVTTLRLVAARPQAAAHLLLVTRQELVRRQVQEATEIITPELLAMVRQAAAAQQVRTVLALTAGMAPEATRRAAAVVGATGAAAQARALAHRPAAMAETTPPHLAAAQAGLLGT